MSGECCAIIEQGKNKGKTCGKICLEKYCEKHIRNKIRDDAITSGIRYCDIKRGCYAVLEEHQSKCKHCLHKARINDRKRDDKKRQDPTLCLDCGVKLTELVRAKGKHNKELRRCIPCYEKLKKYESQRAVRERNYKAEAFTNKHVFWNHYVKSAKKRNIDFGISKTLFNELILKKCFYCEHFKDNEVNGIDRIDNNKGYIEGNAVTCCQICNMMKSTQHPQEFIDKLYAINLFKTMNIPIYPDLIERWKSTYLSKHTPTYKSYQKSANSRNLQFMITEDEFATIVKGQCYLCGIATSEINSNGIDRFNNSIGYIFDNCKSCCGHCNLLKRTVEYNDIIRISQIISNNYTELTKIIATYDIPIRTSKIQPRIRAENPLIEETFQIEYKPTNEVIIPKEIVPDNIIKLLEKEEYEPVPKQWKVKQIYEHYLEDNLQPYKDWCKTMHELTDEVWLQFTDALKDKLNAEQIIRDFVLSLRKLRHNKIVEATNHANHPLERENRQQWPAISVLRAYKEGKIDLFKKFQEDYTGDMPDDVKWIGRWEGFVSSLESATDEERKKFISKFMTAQRTRVYRKKTGTL